jgi:ABC-type uncharacterized transport system substrate-binding protein
MNDFRYSRRTVLAGIAQTAALLALPKASPVVIFVAGGDVACGIEPLVATTPIVTITNDPVARSLVYSLARPGGNVTGVSVDAGLEISGKRLSLLREAVETLSKPYFLTIKSGRESIEGAILRDAAKQLDLSISAIPIKWQYWGKRLPGYFRRHEGRGSRCIDRL